MATEKQERQKAHDVTKVVVRCIPATLTEQELLDLFTEWTDHIESYYLLKNVASMDQSEMCRFYMGFKDLQKALAFHGNFDGYILNDTRLVVELAPYPRLPKASRWKVDAKQGSIDQDAEYLAYVETYESESPSKQSAQSNQEQLLIEMEKRKEARASNQNEVTPLIQSIIDSRTRKDDFTIKVRQEERRKREREAEIAAKKKRDEERRKMLDKREAILKEQRDKEKRGKFQKAEEKNAEREKISKARTTDSQSEEKSLSEKGDGDDTLEKGGLAGETSKAEKTMNSSEESRNETTKVPATSRASRLKDLPSIKYYTPAAKAAKAASSTEPVPEERSYSFLNRDIEDNENTGRERGGGGGKRGFGRRGGGPASGREIKPSRGMHNGGPTYSSRGDKKRDRDNRKDSNHSSQDTSVSVETPDKGKEKEEDRKERKDESTTEDGVIGKDTPDQAKSTTEGEPKKQPCIVKYPRDAPSDGKGGKNRDGPPKSKGKQNRRQGAADDWGIYDDSRQGSHGQYYDCPPAFYSSSWSRGGGKGGGGSHHGSYSSRNGGGGYNQRQYDYGYGHNRNSYDFDRYVDRPPSSSGGQSGKGGPQKAPPPEKINRGSKAFAGESKPAAVFESAERSLKKAEDGGKPPRFSDKRRATALAGNQNSVNADP